MSGRYFLDTNILIYSFDSGQAAKARRAQKLIGDALTTNSGVISYQVVQEFLSFALRRAARPMTASDAAQYLERILRPLLSIHSSPSLYAEGLYLYERYQLSWYDSLIVAAAIQGNCDLLYSEDLQDGQRFGKLLVRNPFV